MKPRNVIRKVPVPHHFAQYPVKAPDRTIPEGIQLGFQVRLRGEEHEERS